MSLIYKKADFNKIGSLESISNNFKEPKKWYSEEDLSYNLTQAKRFGIIDKQEWKILDQYRDKYRNAFSHADMNKTFGNDSGNFWMFKFDQPITSVPQPTNIKISDFLPLQGFAQKKLADAEAANYFLYIDNIVIREEKKRHPEIVKHPEIYKRNIPDN